ncbi:MAG: hypothetical protein C5B51_29740 [Terriglobia bacterium]|nr:MAG: hypothetical protein C5B51_29740 [Terriglobia bacterium]
MQLHGLAEDAREVGPREIVAAGLMGDYHRGVETVRQHVVAKRGGFRQPRLPSGPCHGKIVLARHPIGAYHLAPFIKVQAVGGIGGHAGRIENTRGRESIPGPPAQQALSDGEVQIPRGQTEIGFAHSKQRLRVVSRAGQRCETRGESPVVGRTICERRLDQNQIAALRRGGNLVSDGERIPQLVLLLCPCGPRH